MAPLGDLPTGMYVYIGPVSRNITAGDTLEVGKRSYEVRRIEVIYDRDGPAYLWGLCAQKGGS